MFLGTKKMLVTSFVSLSNKIFKKLLIGNKILDKLKAIDDDYLYEATLLIFIFDTQENIMGKAENTGG